MNLKNTAEEIGISVEAYKRLCRLFLDNTDTDIDKLKTAFAQRRLKDAADIAHHIKGAASNMDFTEMADTAKRLQLKTLEYPSDKHELLDHYQKLAAMYQDIKTEIEAQL